MSDESVESFGIIDVVEAFTAMRHDLKLQSKEGRKLIDAVEQAVTRIERIAEENRARAATDASADTRASATACKTFADALAEIEETVQRTVDAAATWIEARGAGAEDDSGSFTEIVERIFRRQPGWVRWAANGFREKLLEAAEAHQQRREDGLHATLEGLQLMQQRVRKLTDSCNVRRVDVLGKLFDPNQMNALEAVTIESVSRPNRAGEAAASPLRSGEVIEQLRPAYYWNNALLRYAQVRIAR